MNEFLQQILANHPEYEGLNVVELANRAYRDLYAADTDPQEFAQAAGIPVAVIESPEVDEGQVTIEEPGPLRGVLSTALQGATLNFSDEIGAGIRAAPSLAPGGKSFRQAYSEYVEAAREGIESERERYPIGSMVSEGAGALATGLATGGGVLGRPIIGGAIEGGLAGAGAREGSLLDRLAGGAVGAGAGAATGAAFAGIGNAFDMFRPARGRAETRVARALQRGDVDLDEAVAGARPGETLLDVGGPSTRKLGRAAEAVPSEGSESIRSALTRRSEEAATRIKNELQERTGLSFEDAVATVDDLAERRAANAAPLYEAAYRKNVPSGVVEDVLNLDQFQRAYERGRRIASVEGVTLPTVGRVLSDEVDEVPVQAIDYMKRGLDDLIGARGEGASAIGRTEARALRNRLDDVLKDVDEAVPEYAAARAQFAGDAAVQDAFQQGIEDFRGVANQSAADPRVVSRRLDDMTPSEREFYRRGALDAIRRDMETVTDFGRNPDVTRKVVGNEEMRQRVRQLFESEDDFNAFMDAMVSEQNMVQTNRFVLGGSPTARIQEEVADLQTPVENMETGPFSVIASPLRSLQRGAGAADRMLLSRARAGTERTVNELAPLLTQDLFSGGGSLLERLARSRNAEATRRAIFGPLQRGGSILAGGAAGRAGQ